MWMTAASLAGWWLWRCGAIKKIGAYPFGSVLLADPAGDDDPLPIDRGAGPAVHGHGAALAVGPLPDAAAAGRPARRRARCYVGRPRPDLWSGQQAVDLADGRGRRRIGPSRWNTASCARTCSPTGPCSSRSSAGAGGAATRVYFDADEDWMPSRSIDRRAVDHHPRDQGIRRADACSTWSLVLPAILFVRRFPARLWGDPRLAAGSLAAVLLGLYMIDCLLNGFVNIIYITLAGGLDRPGPEAGSERSRQPRPQAATAARTCPRPRSRPSAAAARGAAGSTLADRCRGLGRSLQAGGAAGRGGGRLAAGPRPARRPHRGRARHRTTCGGGGATAPTTWPGCGPITPTRPAATRIPPWRWPAGRWTSAPTSRPTGTPWGPPATAPATTPPPSPPSIAPAPRRRHGLRRRLPGHGACPAGRPGGGPAGARPRHAPGRAGLPGPPRAGRLLRRGPRHPRSMSAAARGRRPLTDPRTDRGTIR